MSGAPMLQSVRAGCTSRAVVLATAVVCVALGVSTSVSRAGLAAPLGLGSCAPAQRVYLCSGLARTWDGVLLDTTVTLPRPGARRVPLVAEPSGRSASRGGRRADHPMDGSRVRRGSQRAHAHLWGHAAKR